MVQRAPHAFWRFSLRVYRAPGVQDACLALQEDRGADVNLLLLCGWQGADGRTLDTRRLRQAIACVGAWQTEVVAAVRGARRAIKRQPPPDAEAAQALRKQILALELDLEYVEQSMLAGLAAQWPEPARRSTPRAAITASLTRYLALLDTPARPSDAAHVACLAAACGEPGATRQ